MQGIPQIGQGQQPTVLPVTTPVFVPLAVGEVVRGEVLNILPDAVSMRVKKEIMVANADIPLEKGTTYLFRVESVSAKEVRLKVLQILAGETEGANNLVLNALNSMKGAYLSHDQILALKTIIDKMPDVLRKKLPELAALKKLFQDIGALTEGSFQESIDATGNFFETKLRNLASLLIDQENLVAEEGGEAGKVAFIEKQLARLLQEDLKGNLLKLKQLLSDPETLNLLKESTVRVGDLAAAVDKLLAHIEQQQLQSKLNTAFQTFLPFAWKELKDGKLMFQESYHARENRKEYLCTIQLDLEKAGRLVTHVRMFNDILHLRFVSDHAHFKEIIEDGRPFLEQQLREIGITCSSFTITQEKTIDFESWAPTSNLDIKV